MSDLTTVPKAVSGPSSLIDGRLNAGNSLNRSLRRGYERGMEDQLGALGLGLNAIIFWNSLRVPTAADDDPEL
ncbi:hypothetical protein [Nonomuraea sp. NPDC050643]|uniref:hypothetical protein n=1 Tax=Nonomuraea sp. NPDC050643 TaxID=3155660 RepID=UPI0033CBC596